MAWLQEAELAYGLGPAGGVAELVRAHRAALEGLPALLPAAGPGTRLPAAGRA